MNTKLKAKWVRALRSDDFKQTRGYLEDGGGHCCLGVLCVVAGLPVKGNAVVGREQEGYEPIADLGIERAVMDECWAKNDGLGTRTHSFTEIADYIEAEL